MISLLSVRKRQAAADGDVTTVSPQLSLKRKGSKDGQKADRKTPQTPTEVSQQFIRL